MKKSYISPELIINTYLPDTGIASFDITDDYNYAGLAICNLYVPKGNLVAKWVVSDTHEDYKCDAIAALYPGAQWYDVNHETVWLRTVAANCGDYLCGEAFDAGVIGILQADGVCVD